jgi:uncharacterized protein
MAFSNEISDKKLLIKTIQIMNQHLPSKRLYLSDLLKMEKPGIKGRDNTFFVIDRSELELISQSLPRFMWGKLRLPLLIERAPDFGSNSARIQGEAEVEVVSKVLKKEKPDKKYIVIYMPEIRELRRILPTATQYAFLASIREDIKE